MTSKNTHFYFCKFVHKLAMWFAFDRDENGFKIIELHETQLLLSTTHDSRENSQFGATIRFRKILTCLSNELEHSLSKLIEKIQYLPYQKYVAKMNYITGTDAHFT